MYKHERTVGSIISGFAHQPRRLISDRVPYYPFTIPRTAYYPSYRLLPLAPPTTPYYPYYPLRTVPLLPLLPPITPATPTTPIPPTTPARGSCIVYVFSMCCVSIVYGIDVFLRACIGAWIVFFLDVS